MSNKYCVDFICTYKRLEDVEESNDLFRSQYLQAFDSENFDMDHINNVCDDLFNLMTIKEADKLNKILATLYEIYAKQLIPFSFKKNYTNQFIFQILFSYDFFDLFHLCLIDLINNNKISDSCYNNLLETINSNSNNNIDRDRDRDS